MCQVFRLFVPDAQKCICQLFCDCYTMYFLCVKYFDFLYLVPRSAFVSCSVIVIPCIVDRVLKAIPKQAFQDCLENCKKHLERCVGSGSTFSVTGAINLLVKSIMFYDGISECF
jgi:hypothetical protein